MAIPYDFKAGLPNAAQLGRSAVLQFTLAKKGDVLSTLHSTKFSPYIGLDLSIINASTELAKISLDGRDQNVPVGGLILNNIYYDEVRVISMSDKGTGLECYSQGILRELAEDLIGEVAAE